LRHNTVADIRLTERNAYRSQAAFLQSVGGTMYTTNAAKVVVPLVVANSNEAAENSVRTWVSVERTNRQDINRQIANINLRIDQYNTTFLEYNRRNGQKIPIQPRHAPMPLLAPYTPPANYN
jgi:hypothetical protein